MTLSEKLVLDPFTLAWVADWLECLTGYDPYGGWKPPKYRYGKQAQLEAYEEAPDEIIPWKHFAAERLRNLI